MPFSEFKHDAHVLLSVMRGKLPQRPNTDIITDDIWSYLTWCWHVNPEKRPSVQQITDFVNTSYGKRNGSYKGRAVHCKLEGNWTICLGRTISYDQKSAEFSYPVTSFTYGPCNRIFNGKGLVYGYADLFCMAIGQILTSLLSLDNDQQNSLLGRLWRTYCVTNSRQRFGCFILLPLVICITCTTRS